MPSEIYTLGVWIVKAGSEDAFVHAWSEFALQTKAEFDGAISVVLLKDATNPRRFVSVGPWRSEEDVTRWRESEAFKDAIGRIKPLLESFQPGSFSPVYRIG
jgi:heme-degrading monooxygenase HmoA